MLDHKHSNEGGFEGTLLILKWLKVTESSVHSRGKM
jgi:hypothetical protein